MELACVEASALVEGNRDDEVSGGSIMVDGWFAARLGGRVGILAHPDKSVPSDDVFGVDCDNESDGFLCFCSLLESSGFGTVVSSIAKWMAIWNSHRADDGLIDGGGFGGHSNCLSHAGGAGCGSLWAV